MTKGGQNAPGQQKQHTIYREVDGQREEQQQTQEYIRTNREQLRADGWQGHGLTDDETETTETESGNDGGLNQG